MRRVWAAGSAVAFLPSLIIVTTPVDAAIRPAGTDIAVTANASPSQIRLGQRVTLTVTATNLGPLPATDVVVRNPLPTSLTLVSSSASVGHHDAAVASWSVDALAVGQSATLTVLVQAKARGHLAAPAALVHLTQVDSDDLNNVDSASIDILLPLVDLVTAQVVTPAAARLGDIVTCTISAVNAGPDNVDSVVIRAFGFELISATPSVGAFDPVSQTWLVGALVPGERSATLTAQVRIGSLRTQAGVVVIEAPGIVDPDPTNNVAAATLNNAAVLSRVDQRDTDPGDNALAARVMVEESADLEITTDVPPVIAEPGDMLTTTTTVTNLGPDQASTVEAAILEAPGVDIVDSSSTGSFDRQRRVWTIGTLRPGQSATLVMRQRAERLGVMFNSAQILQASALDTDVGNNSTRAAVRMPSADVVVLIRAEAARVEVGGRVGLTVVATNIGPRAAQGVSVINMIPSKLSLVDVATTVGSYDPVTGVWLLGGLMPGEIQTLRIRAIASWSGDARNQAVITSTSPVDGDQGDNRAETVLTIVDPPEAATPGSGPGGLTGAGELGWWLTSSGAIGLFLVLAGAALMLARRRDPLSEL